MNKKWVKNKKNNKTKIKKWNNKNKINKFILKITNKIIKCYDSFFSFHFFSKYSSH